MAKIKINIDFENVLSGSSSDNSLSHPVEYLYAYITDDSIATNKNYSEDFLSKIERISGRKAKFTKELSLAHNYWGDLSNIQLARKLNSKITWAKYGNERNFNKVKSFIFDGSSEMPQLNDREYIFKSEFNLSGRGVQRIPRGFQPKTLGVVVELLERKQDFSLLFHPEEEKFIHYKTLVDSFFHFKGCYFEKNFFFPKAQNYAKDVLSEILLSVNQPDFFSIDCFTYGKEESLFFLSEVNYRKSIGQIGYEFSLNFQKKPYGGLFIIPCNKLKKEYLECSLSPMESRIQFFWLEAQSEAELLRKYQSYFTVVL